MAGASGLRSRVSSTVVANAFVRVSRDWSTGGKEQMRLFGPVLMTIVFVFVFP